jgi:hypothetical protein
MVQKQSRAIFQLAQAIGCEWPPIKKAHEETEKARRDLHALLIENVGEKFASEDANLIVFGSMARSEWIDWLSDLDWTFLIDGQCKPLHFQIAQDIREAMKKECRTINGSSEYRFAEPGPTGTFGNMAFSHHLIHLIGGQEDSNKNTTQRILLLLESVPIGAKGVHHRVLKEIIQRYLDEEPNLLTRDDSQFKVPRFLLNDIVRFWRTMAVDFASKQRDRGGQGWGLRNTKLRMSRKLIFVAGLLTCFSCHLNQTLQSKISTEQGDTRSARNFNLAQLQEHILLRSCETPLDAVAAAISEHRIDSSVAKDVFSAYDEFLSTIGDRQKRSKLKQLRADDSRTDPLFKEVHNFSQRFSRALTEIFFSNPQLRPLIQQYGVF